MDTQSSKCTKSFRMTMAGSRSATVVRHGESPTMGPYGIALANTCEISFDDQ